VPPPGRLHQTALAKLVEPVEVGLRRGIALICPDYGHTAWIVAPEFYLIYEGLLRASMRARMGARDPETDLRIPRYCGAASN
jgi:hypothetical protein